METMLDKLKQHIKDTPVEDLQKEFKEIQEEFPDGVNAVDYLEDLKAFYDPAQNNLNKRIRLLPPDQYRIPPHIFYYNLKTKTMINVGDKVIHSTHGGGTVTALEGTTATVRFSDGNILPIDVSTLQKPLYS